MSARGCSMSLRWVRGMTRLYAAMAPARWPLSRSPGGEKSRLFAAGGFPTSDRRARFVATPYRRLSGTSGRAFLLNTGRVRDQWHTMTRTGRVPRLMSHAPEPCVALNPADAARLGLVPGDLARIATEAGTTLLPVAITSAQRPGDIFVPMHWTDGFTGAGPIGGAVTARLDPHSGQPELKATAASVTRVQARFHGVVLRRAGGVLPRSCHWVRVPLDNGQLYRLTGTEGLPEGDALDRFGAGLLGPLPDSAQFVEMADSARGVLRRAALVDGVLEACLLLAQDKAALPQVEAIAPLLGTRIPDGARWRVLVGGEIEATADLGPRVCACFGVGRDTVRNAVLEHGLRSTREIGSRLSAGTNCGSCLPELQAILREIGTREASVGTRLASSELALVDSENA